MLSTFSMGVDFIEFYKLLEREVLDWEYFRTGKRLLTQLQTTSIVLQTLRLQSKTFR